MIIKNNLSSVPTRNYTVYFIGCVALLAGVIAFTAWNISSLAGSSNDIRQLQTKIAQQQSQKDRLQSQADQVSARISKIKTLAFGEEVAFMNNAIKRRVFSWSRLFDLFERLLPQNVRMVSVSPNIKGDEISISMEVAGKSLNDIVELIRVLENSIVFDDVTLRDEKEHDDGLRASISVRYLPGKKEVLPAISTAVDAAPDDQEEQEQPDTPEPKSEQEPEPEQQPEPEDDVEPDEEMQSDEEIQPEEQE